MKTFITSLALAAPAFFLLPAGLVSAADKAPAKPAAAKPAAKPAAAKEKTVKKPVRKPTTAANSSRTQLHSAANQIGAGAVAAAVALSPDELAIADKVHTGHIGCELGQSVNVVKDDKNPGYFHVDGKGFKYHMSPVSSATGAVRLEDKNNGAVWLQIANKSMLMNQKAGQRLADECMSPEQVQVAEAIKRNPPQSLLEAPKPGQ